ncbi:DUF4184 family protein [Phytomonospora endophytica]|uniref:DUF4184 family protein n=1 Tax=Phytomonospora endophytica TaxID=714109 RepID=A0A841FLS6_9ACTN|nr:DUF4184 family protein [Phytomonospora endophytica]MBB6035873.1 hypothetical protein [Phytomonospora endophytica]GIG71132.1 hypothetical protein Pen01_74270 [Phytomonospora endophytica]
MPATVPAHQAAVLPLKLAWPSRFDGVALVVGSTAPDLAYAFLPWWPFGSTHTPLALLWWALPVTVLLSTVIRRLVLPGAAHLPLRRLRLRDYAACARVRHRWWTTLSSALLGAATHIAWDQFTHAGGVVSWLPTLVSPSPFGVPWYKLAQYASGVTGTLVTAWCVMLIAKQRLIRRWHGPAEPPAGDPAKWRGTAYAVGAGLALVAVALPQGTLPHVLTARWLWAGVLAGVAARWRTRRDWASLTRRSRR